MPGAKEAFERLGTALVPSSVIRDGTLEPNVRALYMTMLDDVDAYGVYMGTIDELAQALGVSVRTIRKMLAVHLIPKRLVEVHRNGVHRVFRCTAHAGDYGEPPEPNWDRQIVYFVQGTISGLIKIGTTTNLKKRLQALRTGSAEPLVLLGAIPGGDREEQAFHARFGSQRVQGEWFSPSPELLRIAAGERAHVQG